LASFFFSFLFLFLGADNVLLLASWPESQISEPLLPLFVFPLLFLFPLFSKKSGGKGAVEQARLPFFFPSFSFLVLFFLPPQLVKINEQMEYQTV